MNVPIPTIPPNFQVPNEVFSTAASILAGVAIFYLALGAICLILNIIAYWIIYRKAGEPGWACLIPFYRSYILYKITWTSGWYFFLTWIPGFGAIFCYITLARLCKRFHKSDAFTVGMILLPLVFLCVLAFGKSAYQPVQHPTERPAVQTAPAEAPAPVAVEVPAAEEAPVAPGVPTEEASAEETPTENI